MRQVFPVIHFLDTPTALEQAEVAFGAGADGVFLISHHGHDALLPEVARTIKARFVDKLVGWNMLSLSALESLERACCVGVDMVWADSPGVSSEGLTEEATRLVQRLKQGGTPRFFGSVAFKYQRPEPEPGRAAELAMHLGMVPTTSGPGTGHAPDVAKARLMSEAVQGGELAVASGMTPDNVQTFLPYFSHYLVATGVSLDSYRFNPELLTAFVRQVHAYRAE